MDIGKQIRALRLARGATQEDVAAFLGVSIQAVSKWETEASVPDIALLPAIAVYFGVAIDELFRLPDEAEFQRIENLFWHERQIDPQVFQRSLCFLENAVRSNPKNVRAYDCLANLYNHRAGSDHETAGEYAKKALELNPEDKNAWSALLEASGGVCGDEWYDNHFEVIEFFRDFLKRNPGNYRGLYAIIVNLLADGRYDEAVSYIQQIRTAADTHQYHTYMGDVAFGKGDVKSALEHWNDAVKFFPQRWQAYNDRADRLKKLGRYEEALADYETCFAIQPPPRLTDGLHAMAQLHETLGDFDAAIQDRRRIIRCLKEEYGVQSGKGIGKQEREIARLQKRAANRQGNC